MQIHHNGYVLRDPRIKDAAGYGLGRSPDLPESMDVLIVGAGPAGAMAAAQLGQFGDVQARVIDQRPSRLEFGQADGIHARTLEMFNAFGFADEIIAEGYRITEAAFWEPDRANGHRIHRVSWAPDDPGRLSTFPHLVVNQARVIDYLVREAERGPARLSVDYGWSLEGIAVDPADEHPVAVTLRSTGGPREVRTKYLLACDGAHSAVRRTLGITSSGDRAAVAWGVLDALVETDFPDIRTKCFVQSHTEGNVLLIPREGGYMVRIYVELGEVEDAEADRIRTLPPAKVVEQAQKVFWPYQLDVRHIAWSTVYIVGHRVADDFDDRGWWGTAADRDIPRIFVLGDAGHTHSAKAGQGMNVSMQDAFNLGWKIGTVCRGVARPELLRTYADERQQIAHDLIDFDRRWAALMAKPVEERSDGTDLETFYQSTWEFPSGFATTYPASMVVDGKSDVTAASRTPLGKRFPPVPVVRVAEATTHTLQDEAPADGRWRLYVFAPSIAIADDPAVTRLAGWLAGDARSPLVKAVDLGAAVWTEQFDIAVVYRRHPHEIDIEAVPSLFLPPAGRFALRDRGHVWALAQGRDIFDELGIAEAGCVIVVRPDQYVASIQPFDAVEAIADFFDSWMRPMPGTG